MSARADARAYFDEQLNYSLGDEDTSVELAAAPEGARHVVAVAGSGGRVVPLLARAPRRLTCVDVSRPQLALAEMRLAAVRALEHEEYVSFLGYPPAPMTATERAQCFRGLALSEPARSILKRIFEDRRYAPIVYLGRFEQALAQLSRVNRLLTGGAGQGLFQAADLEAQRDYLTSVFPHRRFRLVLLLLGNAAVLNSLLYKGELPKQNLPGSTYAFYRRIFDRLFTRAPARESYFLQFLFFGALRYAEGNPLECDAVVYERARQCLGDTRVSFVLGDVVNTVRGASEAVDFLSLSDVPTFFKGSLEHDFLQQLRPGLERGAIVVTRGHLRVLQPIVDGFEVLTASYEEAIDREKTQLWTIQIYRMI